jgi:hypothetical protein
LFTLSPPIALLGMVGMFRLYRERPSQRWLLWVAWAPTLFFTFRSSVLLTFVPLARFAVNQVALLLPFVALGFEALVAERSPAFRRAAAALCIAVALASPTALGLFTFQREGRREDALRPVSPTSTNSPALMRVSARLASELSVKGSYVLDSDPGYRDLQIAFFAGLPDERVARHRWKHLDAPAPSLDPEYLVLFPGGRLQGDGRAVREGEQVRLDDWRFVPVGGFPLGDAAEVTLLRRVREAASAGNSSAK